VEERDTKGRQPARSGTILVVDDDEGMRHLLGRMLCRAGFEVVPAFDGEDGLARYRECNPDLVITDMKMPRMNGLELVEALVRENADVKAIAISGIDSQVRHLNAAVRAGAKASLLKPVTATDLVQTVEEVLGLG
jgi:DNA-binding NtrC family response regulator